VCSPRTHCSLTNTATRWWYNRDEVPLAALCRHYLAPLAALPEPTRDRLLETLKSWLMNRGNRKAVAGELHVHPQTLRYRLTQLRELFDSALDNPATRAALLLALAWGLAATESDPLAHHASTVVLGS
jgi:DNA-binding PucR family transcriptional regulator